MNKRTKDSVVACLALGATAMALYIAFGARSPKINLDAYDVLGAITAEETAKLVGDQGLVLVMARATADNPSVETELKAFSRSLEKRAGIRLITEQVEVTPMLMMSTGGALPPEHLFRALEHRTNVAALVLFFGFPALAEAELQVLEKQKLKTVVVSSFHPSYKPLLERGIIHLAIVPRPDEPPPGAATPRTVRARFDQTYRIIKPAEAALAP